MNKIRLTEENMRSLLIKINVFLGKNFSHSHDWLRYHNDNEGKVRKFSDLRFEKRYPTHHFNNAVWRIDSLGDNNPKLLRLFQKEYHYHLFTIPIGSDLVFNADCLYVFDTAETATYFAVEQHVSKYFKKY